MNRSLKWMAPAAAALAFAAGAHAQSTVQLYGLMDASVGRYKAAGGVGAYQVDSGDMTTSFLGFKGTEDLGGGLKARFAIEHFLRLDTGAAGRFNGDAFWARNAYVGLSGGFGTVTLGRNTNPFFVSTLAFNAIGDSFGWSPSIRQVLTPNARSAPFYGDTGWSNSILYSSDTYNGFALNAIGNVGEGAAGSVGKNVGANVTYFGGPLGASLAVQQVKNGLGTIPTGFKEQNSYQGGISYDLGVVKFFGQATLEKVKTNNNTGNKANIYGLGASVPLGGGSVLAQYGWSKSTFDSPRVAFAKVTDKTLTVGYDYNLSKRTDVYAMGLYDKITGLSNGKQLGVGVRHRF